ncbi:MAG: AAA family ATPase [Chlorobiaceae bacterium]
MLKESAVREVLPFGKPSKSFDIIGFLKRYGIFILFLGSFLFAMLTPLIFIIKNPYYEVHAFLKVEPVVSKLISTSDETSIVNYYQDYANTQAHTIKTFDLLKLAVEHLNHRERNLLFPGIRSSEICADILDKMITVRQTSGTQLLEITISGSKPDGLAEMVNKLMNVYIKESRNKNNSTDSDRLKYLYDQKKSIEKEIAIYEQDLDGLTKDISTASFTENFNIAAKNRETLANMYDYALTDRIKAEANYEKAKNLNKEILPLTLEPFVEELVKNDNSLHMTDAWTYQQLQEMRSTTDGLTPNNPDRIYVEQRMNAMKNYEIKKHNEVRNTSKSILYGKRSHDMKKELIQAKTELDKTKKTELDILQEVEKNLKESKRVSIGIHKGENISELLRHKREMLDILDKRITEIEIENKAPSRISIESFARTPKTPLKSNTKNLVTMLFLGSFGIVAGVFFVYEFFDDSIRRPQDVLQALGYPPTQTIIDIDKQKDNEQQLSLAPDDFKAHMIGSLAIKFCREKEKDNTRIILFTGIEKGVGSSSIAFSSAKALARIAPKVLMIDGDIEVNPVEDSADFSLNLPGLCDYLYQGGLWKEYIISTPGDNLDIMYAGSITSKPIPRHQIRELLNEVKKEYDFICIDGAPLLKSHLTEHFSIYSDIVALVCLGESSRFKDLRKCAELLIRLGVPGIAPILNFGGIKQTLTIEELFDNPPEFIQKIMPKQVINFIKKSPSLHVIDKFINYSTGNRKPTK